MAPLPFGTPGSCVPFAVGVFCRGRDLGTSVGNFSCRLSFAAAFFSPLDGADGCGTSVNSIIIEIRIGDQSGQSSCQAGMQNSSGCGRDIDFHLFVSRLWTFRTGEVEFLDISLPLLVRALLRFAIFLPLFFRSRRDE